MKHNYIIICLDSMFETFCVADEFVFLRFWDVFDISLPVIQFRSEVTESLWVLKCVCHISFCNVSRRVHKHFLFVVVFFSNNKSVLYHGNWWQRAITFAPPSCSHHFPVAICVHVIWVFRHCLLISTTGIPACLTSRFRFFLWVLLQTKQVNVWMRVEIKWIGVFLFGLGSFPRLFQRVICVLLSQKSSSLLPPIEWGAPFLCLLRLGLPTFQWERKTVSNPDRYREIATFSS